MHQSQAKWLAVVMSIAGPVFFVIYVIVKKQAIINAPFAMNIFIKMT